MPKVIRCKTCNKVILRVKGHAGKDKIMSAIRHHYMKSHPQKFKRFSKKASVTKEMKEHPQLTSQQARTIARQHEKGSEPSWHEWKYYGGEIRGEPEPENKY
jgi:hypothetical protein